MIFRLYILSKEVKEPKSHAFVDELLRDVVRRKEGGVKLSQKIQEVEGLLLSPVANIAKTDRPEVAVIIEKRKERTRFKKTGQSSN